MWDFSVFGVQGHSDASIKIAIFKTLRRLDITWNFPRSITRVYTHEHKHWTLFVYAEINKKKVFGQLTLAWRYAVMSDKSVDPQVRPNR